MKARVVTAKALTDFATDALHQLGVPAVDAALVADTLVQADLWGHSSHGVMRLPWYAARLRSGVMQAAARPELVVDAGAVAVMHGHDGIGQVMAHAAAQEATRRAKAHGIGAVAVRNSNHFGTAMYFTRRPAAHDQIGILVSNASPAMAPWGGLRQSIGTNPWSLAAPAGKHSPFVLDIANTGVARGKIYLAKQEGREIPLGWALNPAGVPTTSPADALAGLILPMGEHKGYAIAVMMDVLAGVLSGSVFGAGVTGPYQAEKRSGCGHLMLALDIAAFLPVTEFHARMEQLVAELKAGPRAPGFDEIFYPGEPETRSDARLRASGIALPDQTVTDLDQLAASLGRGPLAAS